MSFSLPDATPATLAVYDVSGREVIRHDVGALGVGRHTVMLGTSETMSPGVYLVRLTQGERMLTARAVVTR